MLVFRENLMCFVFLLPPFKDSLFCLILYAPLSNSNFDDLEKYVLFKPFHTFTPMIHMLFPAKSWENLILKSSNHWARFLLVIWGAIHGREVIMITKSGGRGGEFRSTQILHYNIFFLKKSNYFVLFQRKYSFH